MELLVTWEFDGVVFEWSGDAAWHFVRLPVEVAEEILADDVVQVELTVRAAAEGDEGQS